MGGLSAVALGKHFGLRFLPEMDLSLLTEFRAGWHDGAFSSLKKLERLRTFFRFGEEHDWINGNPARKLFRLAKVNNGHAHRFRDTFAVELLLAGVPIERVSILLGHQSIKITERHYSLWTRPRRSK